MASEARGWEASTAFGMDRARRTSRADASAKGFGSTLLDRVLAMQANAKVQITFDTQGLTFRMEAAIIEQRLVPEY